MKKKFDFSAEMNEAETIKPNPKNEYLEEENRLLSLNIKELACLFVIMIKTSYIPIYKWVKGSIVILSNLYVFVKRFENIIRTHRSKEEVPCHIREILY